MSGDLSNYYFAAIKGEQVNWEKVANTFKGKLSSEFVHENVLRTRVNALKALIRNSDQYWSEYIKYNIELIDKYGTDTTNKFADAIDINNFVFDAIFYHSTDPAHFKIALKWMEGVLRRNPEEPNHIDTYANLLYKAGQKQVAIEWQEKAVDMAKKTQSIFLNNLKRI